MPGTDCPMPLLPNGAKNDRLRFVRWARNAGLAIDVAIRLPPPPCFWSSHVPRWVAATSRRPTSRPSSRTATATAKSGGIVGTPFPSLRCQQQNGWSSRYRQMVRPMVCPGACRGCGVRHCHGHCPACRRGGTHAAIDILRQPVPRRARNRLRTRDRLLTTSGPASPRDIGWPC